MTIWLVDIMWGMMLFGITLFLSCFIVCNRAMSRMRIVGLITSYATGLWMALVLPWQVALATWCVIAATCGAVCLAYELWARRKYPTRKPRPLILLQGFLLFPALLPDALEGMVVDLGILPPSPARAEDDPYAPRPSESAAVR